MSERVSLIVELTNDPQGALLLRVRNESPGCALHVRAGFVLITIWAEGEDAIRIAAQHRRSRTLAYLQGNRALRELCAGMRLELQRERPRSPAES